MALGVLGAAAVSFSRPYTLAGSAETLMPPPLFYNYCEEDEWELNLIIIRSVCCSV